MGTAIGIVFGITWEAYLRRETRGTCSTANLRRDTGVAPRLALHTYIDL